MASAIMALSPLPGIDRPALLAVLPTDRGNVAVLDVGGNVAVKAAPILQNVAKVALPIVAARYGGPMAGEITGQLLNGGPPQEAQEGQGLRGVGMRGVGYEPAAFQGSLAGIQKKQR